ncbi:ABC transporter ATP-binding protein [Desulfosporosinus shakirovi]|uniref:ABC transporter ATP-binding protein n=1 Tax=Desulfosporosinus shakirovi TaxID=2885154 RepID=UPI001E3096BF|nr:ABC transporter ATP-binding protein [Desulfosporosinus sp. SRJS8]MCB8816715.1 ABC transporter ATP-binding protein/permease [Desulfosporosinus sp. SRJS8]
MISMLRCTKELLGGKSSLLIPQMLLSVIDSLLNASMFGMMILTLMDLAEDSFTMEKLKTYLMALAGLFVIRCLVLAGAGILSQCRGADISRELRLRLGNHIRCLNLGFFNKNSIGRLNSTLMTDIGDFETVLTHSICDFIKIIVFTLVALGVALVIDLKYALVIVLLVGIALPLLTLSGEVSAKNSAALSRAMQMAVSRIVEYISGIKTFRLYNLTGEKFERLDESLKNLKKEATHSELSVLPYTISFSTITSCIIPLALIMGTYFLTRQTINTISFLAIIMLAISISSMMTGLSALYPQMKFLTRASGNILDILNEKPFPYEYDRAELKGYDLKFEDVYFRYTYNLDVLKNISFTAPAGTTTALIGPSGSGKTTIISLISRFWDVNEGRITIGDEDIRTFAPDSLTEQMTVVFQEVYLFNDTVFNNIKIGKPQATKEEVITAAQAANCHEFILKMEHGYDTMIGEGGSTLSGGEKQRISIARAFLKDAPIVLLDESTSSLDADNEQEIQLALDRLMKGKTVLVIAHRLNTIIKADKILVLSQGEILESGNHTQLLLEKGWYARMYTEQEKARGWQVTA